MCPSETCQVSTSSTSLSEAEPHETAISTGQITATHCSPRHLSPRVTDTFRNMYFLISHLKIIKCYCESLKKKKKVLD